MSHCCQHSAGVSVWQWGRLRRGREKEEGQHTVKAIAGRRDARVCRGTIYCHTAAGRRGDALRWSGGGGGLQCSSVKRSWSKTSKMHYRRCKRPERKWRKRRRRRAGRMQRLHVKLASFRFLPHSAFAEITLFVSLRKQVGGELHIPEWLDWLPNEMNRQSNKVLIMDPLSLEIIWLVLQKWSCYPSGMDKWSPNLKWNSASFIKWAPLIWSHLAEMEPIGMTKGSTSTPKNVNLHCLQNGPHYFSHTTERELLVPKEVDL